MPDRRCHPTFFLILIPLFLALACNLPIGLSGQEVAPVEPGSPGQGDAQPAAPEEPPESGAGDAASLGLSRARPMPRFVPVEVPGWRIRVQDFLRGEPAWQVILEDNENAPPPPDGMEYVVVEAWIQCTQDGEYAQDIGIDELYVTGARGVQYTDGLNGYPVRDIFYNDFFYGEEDTGLIDALVPVGETNLLLVFNKRDYNGDLEGFVRYFALEPGASLTVPPDLAGIQPTDQGVTPDDPVPFGEMAVSEDWEVTILDILRGDEAEARIEAEGLGRNTLQEGMERALVRARVRLISTEDVEQCVYSSRFVFVHGDGEWINSRFHQTLSPALSTCLYPGGVAEGWMTLETTAGETLTVVGFNPAFREAPNARYFSVP